MEGHDPRPWEAFHNQEISGRGWTAYGESRTGSNRASNEDNYILAPLAHDRLLVAVADGLGGHNAGQIASRVACETLFDAARNGTLDPLDDNNHSILESLEAIILDAHQRIAMWSQDIAAFEGMGCTLTAAIVDTNRAWYCHVGDSRLYQIGLSDCQQITDDNGLDQALGLEEQHNRLKIQQGTIDLLGGDALLLCSDGVQGSLVEPGLADSVRGDVAIGARVQQLIEASLAAGSGDDITAVLVSMPAGSLNN